MKKQLKILAGVCMLACVVAAVAGTVAARTTAALGAATGSATWTNTYQYAALDLKRITIDKCLAAVDTVTVYRVTSDNVYTGTVGTVTTSSNKGTQTTLAYNYLQYGDKLVFDSGKNTGSTAIIEFEVQKH